MTTKEPSNHSFGLLPEEKRDFKSLCLSALVNLSVAGGLLALSMSAVHVLHEQNMIAHDLVFTPPPKVVVPPPQPHFVLPAPTMPSKISVPEPKPVKAPPKIRQIKMPSVPLPKLSAPPLRVAPPPKPKVGLFKNFNTAVTTARTHAVVHTANFGNSPGANSMHAANRKVTLAAFGASAAAPSTSPRGAVHGVAFGDGVAEGAARGHDHGEVASAGFDNGAIGGTGARNSRGRVTSAAFGGNMYGASRAPRSRVQRVNTTPIIVLWKPLPSYTSAALQQHIQGSVTLKVCFRATGQVQVLDVVHGLGYGLDKQAEVAASEIRFKPATRNGRPVDAVRIIQISFQMT